MTDQTARDGRPAWRVVTWPLTSVRDGYEHLIAESAMTAPRAGRFTTLCGRAGWAAALTCPPGPQCRACVAVRDADATGGLRHRQTRQRRTWALTAWLRPHSHASHSTLRRREVPAKTDGPPDGW